MSEQNAGAAAAQEAANNTEHPNTDQQAQPSPADLAAQAQASEQQPAEPQQEPATEQQAETFDRDYVEKLRKEAASYRTKAKEVEEAKAGELDAFKQEMAKALGLVEDESDDPTKLLEAATKREQDAQAERDKMAEQLANYRRSDAVNTAVGGYTEKNGGKVDTALLNAVLNSDNALSELDINADEYNAQVADLVNNAIQQHPSLVQATHPTASGVDTSTTNSGASRRITVAELDGMTPKEIYEAQKAGLLDHLTKK